MSEDRKPRVLGVSMQHPGASERLRGETSRAQLAIDRGLKSGRVEFIDLTEDDLIQLARKALDCVAILRRLP